MEVAAWERVKIGRVAEQCRTLNNTVHVKDNGSGDPLLGLENKHEGVNWFSFLAESHLLKLISAVWAEGVLQAVLLEAFLHLRVT